MGSEGIDQEKLRAALRRMSRGDLLMVAERAVEVVSRRELEAIVGDMVLLEDFAKAESEPVPLLDEVRRFHAAALAGEYYESFMVDSRNFTMASEGTDAFTAEFHRLERKCVRAAGEEPPGTVREAFDLLFAVLRRIDEGSDDVVFFADEGGSWEFGVDWRAVLSAYFRCLAETESGEAFAVAVDRVITDFVEYDRAVHLDAALRVASAEQQAALERLR